MPALFCISGYKNVGKTTLTERLVHEITSRGLVVSTIKHAHHRVDIDQDGRDSYRHREAGAREVALVSGARWALMHELRGEPEPPLSDILSRLSPCDLVLVEGYKQDSHPKIEVRRSGVDRPPLADGDESVVAIACDHDIPGTQLPVFHLDDITEMADFVLDHVGLEPRI